MSITGLVGPYYCAESRLVRNVLKMAHLPVNIGDRIASLTIVVSVSYFPPFPIRIPVSDVVPELIVAQRLKPQYIENVIPA